MRHPIRVFALAWALTFAPACASLKLGEATIENPVRAARTIDQRAYALLHSYAAVLEEATDVVRDANAPIAFKRALGRAERGATPAAETLEIAVAGYVRARGAFEAASSGDQTGLERAKIAAEIAVRRLEEALTAAEAPMAELQALVEAQRQ
jgi:hypothetical protein